MQLSKINVAVPFRNEEIFRFQCFAFRVFMRILRLFNKSKLVEGCPLVLQHSGKLSMRFASTKFWRDLKVV